MSKSITDSFERVAQQFRVVLTDLVHKQPILVCLLVIIAIPICILISKTQFTTIAILCLIISLISAAIYIKTESFAETSLTFILGLFTAFSIEWTSGKAILIILFFLAFSVLIFVISAIRLSSKIEWILTQAAVQYQPAEHKPTYEELYQIASAQTPYGQLHIVERAESTRYFAFRKININRIKRLLILVERVTTSWSITHLEACEFLYALFMSVSSKEEDEAHLAMIDFLNQAEQIPCVPSMLHEYLISTTPFLIAGAVSHDDYLKIIKTQVKIGGDKDAVKDLMRRRFNDPTPR
jgi:hypothetical protein